MAMDGSTTTRGEGRGRRRWGLVIALVVALATLPSADLGAAAPPPGTITGTITGPGGVPVEGATVVAYGSTYYEEGGNFDETAADGTYEITVRAGNYAVEVVPPADSDLAPERWDDSYGRPTPVAVAAGAETADIDAELAVGSVLSGVVTDDEGAPVEGAEVSLDPWWGDAPGWGYPAQIETYTETDETGAWELRGLPPTYLLMYVWPPSGTDLYPEYYGDAFTRGTATPILTALGVDQAGLDVQLGLGAVVTGTVTNAAGAPVSGVQVYVETVECCEGGFGSTAADGTYEITVGPGEYTVHFYAPSPYLREWYDDAFTYAQAEVIAVGEAEVVDGIDAELDVPGTASGRVTSLSGRGIPGVQVILTDELGAVFGDTTNSAGVWSNNRLPAGDYTVQFRAAHASEWYSDLLTPDGAATITVPAGGSVTGIDGTLDQIVFGQELEANGTIVVAQCSADDPATFDFEVVSFDTSDGTTGGSIDFGDGSTDFAFSAAGATTSHTYTWGGGASTGPASEIVVSLTGGPVQSDSYTVVPGYTGCADDTATFSDVPPSHLFFDEIECLVDLGVTEGYEDGTFQPTGNITRQGAVAWLWRMEGSPEPDSLPEFSDVPEGHPFADAIAWAAENNIVGGFPDGRFHPRAPVTRAAVAVWIRRSLGSPPGTLPTGFSDVPDTHQFARDIAFVAHAGIASGYADGTFRPERHISRQGVAAWMCRASGYSPYFPGGPIE
jgi:protocatechuate 3,4-dioxygenase beta subunit